jgi:hypothetical protein
LQTAVERPATVDEKTVILVRDRSFTDERSISDRSVCLPESVGGRKDMFSNSVYKVARQQTRKTTICGVCSPGATAATHKRTCGRNDVRVAGCRAAGALQSARAHCGAERVATPLRRRCPPIIGSAGGGTNNWSRCGPRRCTDFYGASARRSRRAGGGPPRSLSRTGAW